MIKVTVSLNGVERVINGNGQHIKGTITQEVGAINSFEFEIFPQNIGYELIQSRKTIVKAINTLTNRVEFAGRVLLAETKMENNGVISKRVTCESYLGYLYDSVQPFREEQTMTLRYFLELVLINHNARVESEKRIQLGTVNVDVAGTGNVTKGLQYETTYDTIKNKLVDIYGGELEVVENEGALTLNYVKQIGTTRATTIELGRNMQAASREVSPLNIITRVIPLGAKIKKIETDEENNPVEVETGERLTLVGYTPVAGEPALTVPWIDDEEKQKECGIVCGVLELEDVTEQSNLYRKTIEYMKNENLVALSHTLTALDLKEIGQDIDSLNCGDSYPVKNVLIGLDETLRITKKTIDINAPYKGSITIGEKRATLSSIQAGTNATIGELFGTIQTINKVTNNLKDSVSSTEKSVNELTSKVEGIDGTYFYIRYSPYADGHVMTDAPEADTVYMGTCSTSESTAPTDYTKYTWARIKGYDGENGTAGDAGKDGVSQYLHIKYSNDGINFTEPNGETLGDWLGTCVDNNEKDPADFDAYEWHKIKGEQGLAGKDGIGIDGTSSYFHVRYSEVENPTKAQMTENPSKYIGTYVDNIEDDSDDPTKYKWVKFMGTDGIAGKDGENGKTYYLHIKYSDDGGKTFTANNGETSGKYIGVYTDTTEADSSSVSAYKWSLLKGSDGITYYTWIKYADSPTSGMSDSPEGKTYMGIAYNKTNKTESTTYSDYTWSLIKGANGVDGDDGKTYYTWVKYADNENGLNMSDDPTGKKYIGLAYNQTTPTESNNAGNYTWALFRGADGIDGADGKDGTSTYFYVRYSANSNGANMTTSPQSDTEYMGVCSTTSTTAPTSASSYTWTKVKGQQGIQGIQGTKGENGKSSYLHIKYSDDGATFTANNGEDLGAWIGTSVDFTEADSTTFSDYTWKKFTEDVDEELENIRESVVTLATNTIHNSETIGLMASKEYVETSTFDGYKKTIEESIASLLVENDNINLKFDKKTTEINDVESKLTEFYKYFRFTENGLEIRSSNSIITLEIDNDMIVFKKNGVKFGWWDGENFHTGNIVVEVNERAQFGNFAFVPRSSGSLSFLKVDDALAVYVADTLIDGTLYIGTETVTLANEAYKSRTDFTKLVIPNTLSTIGVRVFQYCTNLESVTIAEDVTTIGQQMFESCTKLKTIKLPSTIKRIQLYAFYNCSSLTDVYYGGTQEQWNNIVIGTSNTPIQNATIHYNS